MTRSVAYLCPNHLSLLCRIRAGPIPPYSMYGSKLNEMNRGPLNQKLTLPLILFLGSAGGPYYSMVVVGVPAGGS